MRILQVAALFTVLFIAYGGCRPNAVGNDYAADEDYDEETSFVDNREVAETDSTPSQIYTRSQKLLVRLGQEVHLPCNVSNPTEILVIWRRGTTQLYSDGIPHIQDTNRIMRRDDNTLIIKNFGPGDVSDEYICEITSIPVQKITHSIRTSRYLFVEPSNQVGVNGTNETITLSCEANWKPKPKVSWSRAGTKLPSDRFPEDGSSLTITNVSHSDAGLYQCLAESNEPGTDPTVRGIEVLFPSAPQIEVDSETVHTGMKMESELTCRVHAFPQASLKWLKDGKEIVGRGDKAEPKDSAETKHTLVFSSTDKSKFGIYTCEATNTMGSAKRSITLTGIPTEAKLINGATTPDGITPILEWLVESYSPIIEYRLEYRREGEKEWKVARPKATDDGTRNTFKIKYPMEGLQAGRWEARLLARNDFGWSPTPSKPYTFTGEYITDEPEIDASKSGAAAIESLVTLRSLLLSISALYVYTTYL